MVIDGSLVDDFKLFFFFSFHSDATFDKSVPPWQHYALNTRILARHQRIKKNRLKLTFHIKTTPITSFDAAIIHQNFHALFQFILQSSIFELSPIDIEYVPIEHLPLNGNRERHYHLQYFSVVDHPVNNHSDQPFIGVRNTTNQRKLFISFEYF